MTARFEIRNVVQLSRTDFRAEVYLLDAVGVGSYQAEVAISGVSGVSYSYQSAAVAGAVVDTSSGAAAIAGYVVSATGIDFGSSGLLIGTASLHFSAPPASGLDLQVQAADLMSASFDPMSYVSFGVGIIPDSQGPQIVSGIPVDGSTVNTLAADISLSFNEAIQRGTGVVELRLDSATGALVESFDAATSNRLGLSGASLVINPTADLQANQHYVVSFSAGSLQDSLGNPMAVTSAQDFFTSAGRGLDVQAYSWNAHTLLSGVSVASATLAGTTNASGAAHFDNVTATTLDLSVSRTVPAAEAAATNSAVNLQDAIAILKMVVGLPVNSGGHALSPYQALAADYDGNGTVNLSDAIGVLKHVVGLSAPDPTWHFANELDTSVPTRNNTSPGTTPAISANLSSSTGTAHVGLVGWLSGDVDGSYAGPSGASTLSTSYFSALVDAHVGLSLPQFGVYA